MTLFGEPEPTDYDKSWLAFRAVYPRKEKWVDAHKAWVQLKPSAELAAAILHDIELRKANNWAGKDKVYIPLPGSYLRGHRWEDEIYKSGRIDSGNGRYDKFVRK